MIVASLNLYNGVWTVEEDDSAEELGIGFTSEKPTTEFNSVFSFGWSLSIDGKEVDKKEYPLNGVSYTYTDQKILVDDQISVRPDDNCQIHVWVVHGGMRFDRDINWVVARPESPHPAWVWDSNHRLWVAPVPVPDMDHIYRWDDEINAWVVADIYYDTDEEQ